MATPLDPHLKSKIMVKLRAGCVLKVQNNQKMQQYIKRTGRDISDYYCDCMTQRSTAKLTMEEVQAASNGNAGANPFTKDLDANADACMKEIMR